MYDPMNHRQGIMYIFTVKGESVRSLDEMYNGHDYVCSSKGKYLEIHVRI